MNITPDLSIGIIGGAGKTGSQFAELFRAQGFEVDVTGEDDKDRNPELIQKSDIVIFSVPLEFSAKIIEEEIVHAIREDQLVMDLSSLKVKQVAALSGAAGEAVGLHPLFGPSTDPAGQTIVLCPARAEGDTIESVLSLFANMNLNVKMMSAEEHDKLMALLQVVPHLKSYLVADTLKKLDANIDKIIEVSTPAYAIELDLIGRFLDDSPHLYGPMILDNPMSKEILRNLRDSIDHCLYCADHPEGTSFNERYGELQEFFGRHCKEGRARSEDCIRILTKRLS